MTVKGLQKRLTHLLESGIIKEDDFVLLGTLGKNGYTTIKTITCAPPSYS